MMPSSEPLAVELRAFPHLDRVLHRERGASADAGTPNSSWGTTNDYALRSVATDPRRQELMEGFWLCSWRRPRTKELDADRT